MYIKFPSWLLFLVLYLCAVSRGQCYEYVAQLIMWDIVVSVGDTVGSLPQSLWWNRQNSKFKKRFTSHGWMGFCSAQLFNQSAFKVHIVLLWLSNTLMVFCKTVYKCFFIPSGCEILIKFTESLIHNFTNKIYSAHSVRSGISYEF